MYAYCLIEYPIKTLDKAFTYLIPSHLQAKLKVGMKVIVPFHQSEILGIVLRITNEYQEEYQLKEIIDIADEFLILNNELLKLGQYLKEKTLCSLITAYQVMLPSALKIKKQAQNYSYYEKYITLAMNEQIIIDFVQKHRASKKTLILKRLLQEREIAKKELDANAIRELKKLGLVQEIKHQKYRLAGKVQKISPKTLTQEQQIVYNTIINNLNQEQTYLLYGVTGSGKTQVYIDLIKEVIKRGQQALILVPEISLTEQVIKIFYDNFGNEVAILHSGLSKGEKYDEYLKILNNQIKIVIGTRSAIFAPLTNIGLIIIDEEHSESYKQESTPRYHAIDIANQRKKYHHCPLILGSATPSLESMARAQKGVYQLLTIKNRANNLPMPQVSIISMQEEQAKRNFIISDKLDESIRLCLSKNEQLMLLLNRRGFSTIITCSNCGYTYKCPHCEITLTYHKSSNTLRCHYCGYSKIKDDKCPKCHEKCLNYYGMGTEKLEEIIKTKYPNAKTIRMDADTTSKKGAIKNIIASFRSQEYNILIGTQMISKGFDFSNCTLVGIINADATLNIPDFRSSERTFALLDQAAGRAGRSNKIGQVIIQTFNPNNPTILAVQQHDYLSFYKQEMQIRKILKYPPYYYLISIKICSNDYEQAQKEALKVKKYLLHNLTTDSIILGPSTALNFKIKNIYRFNITIKYRFDNKIYKVLKELDLIYATNKKVYLEIDINPLHI